MPSELTLRHPREDEEDEFLRAHRATSPQVPSFLHGYEDGMPFRRYLQVLADHERGIGLPSPDQVPSTFLFAFAGARIVGRASIRHRLTAHLERHGCRPEFIAAEGDGRSAGQVLLNHVERLGADMVVMGLYGHTRFRELFLGGVSKEMLERSPVPLLVSH